MKDRVSAGIGLGVLAYSLFATHDAANKWLVGVMPIWEVMFCRSIMIVTLVLVISRGRVVTQALATPLKKQLLLRSALTLVAWLLYYTAARDMSLAQLMTLYFSSPLMTMVLAVPLLGERVTAARWGCAAIGFAGVLVASDPFGVRFSLAAGLVLMASAMWGYAIILMRQISRRESSMVQMLYQNLLFFVVTSGLMLVSARVPVGVEIWLLMGIGVFGGLGQYLLFEGARLAPASVMSTVEYTGLVWAFLLGYLVWGDFPSTAVWCGAGLISLSGVLLVVSERWGRVRH